MTPAEIRAYNAGVADVLAIARRSALILQSSTIRPLAEGFAIEALTELAKAGVALLLPEVRGSQPANPRPLNKP